MKWVPVPHCGSRMGLGFRDAKKSFGCLGARGMGDWWVRDHGYTPCKCWGGAQTADMNGRVLSPVAAWHISAACGSPPSLVDVLDSPFVHCC